MTAIAELALERFEVCPRAGDRAAARGPGHLARGDSEVGSPEGPDVFGRGGNGSRAPVSASEGHADHIINRENVQWLIEQSGLPFQYDMLVIDELSSFKSHQAKRFRALIRMRPRVARVVGLTGTPSSNGLMDLWAEFRLLDMGKRLGRFITHYREAFFLPDRRSAQQVFTWKPKPGAEDEIYRRISDITISMKSADYLAHARVHFKPCAREAVPGGTPHLRTAEA